MIDTQYSFAQLQNQPLDSVEIIGIIGGSIFQEVSPTQGISLTLAPHEDEVISGVSLDARVTVFKPGVFGDSTLRQLMAAEQLENRIRVKGTYTPPKGNRSYGKIEANVIEIQPYA